MRTAHPDQVRGSPGLVEIVGGRFADQSSQVDSILWTDEGDTTNGAAQETLEAFIRAQESQDVARTARHGFVKG